MVFRPLACRASFLLLTISSAAFAHPEGFSGQRVQVRADGVHAELTIHTRDTTRWFPPDRFPDYVPQVARALEASAGELLEIAYDGQLAAVREVKAFSPEAGLMQIDLAYPPPPSGARELRIWSKHLPQLPRGHQQLLFVSDAAGGVLLEAILSVDEDAVTCDLPRDLGTTRPSSQPLADGPPRPPPRRISFFLLGIEHIVTGYDHLLFLAALLLVATSFREAAAVVTFFTVAHSITLSLAALDVVRLPGGVVEPAIAASIVYVGIENLIGGHRFAWRAAVTFAFGLVHGLGFASVLREVGLGSTEIGVAMPLLMFSVGLETGQLCIAAVMLYALLSLRKNETFERRWVPSGSVLVSLIGLYWLVTRLLGS